MKQQSMRRLAVGIVIVNGLACIGHSLLYGPFVLRSINHCRWQSIPIIGGISIVWLAFLMGAIVLARVLRRTNQHPAPHVVNGMAMLWVVCVGMSLSGLTVLNWNNMC